MILVQLKNKYQVHGLQKGLAFRKYTYDAANSTPLFVRTLTVRVRVCARLTLTTVKQHGRHPSALYYYGSSDGIGMTVHVCMHVHRHLASSILDQDRPLHTKARFVYRTPNKPYQVQCTEVRVQLNIPLYFDTRVRHQQTPTTFVPCSLHIRKVQNLRASRKQPKREKKWHYCQRNIPGIMSRRRKPSQVYMIMSVNIKHVEVCIIISTTQIVPYLYG